MSFRAISCNLMTNLLLLAISKRKAARVEVHSPWNFISWFAITQDNHHKIKTGGNHMILAWGYYLCINKHSIVRLKLLFCSSKLGRSLPACSGQDLNNWNWCFVRGDRTLVNNEFADACCTVRPQLLLFSNEKLDAKTLMSCNPTLSFGHEIIQSFP